MVRGRLPGSSAMAPGQGLVAGDGGAFGQVAAHEAVGVLVRAPFPRAVGVGEEHVDPGGGGQALVAGHFAPLVPGQGAHRAVGQCADAAGEGVAHQVGPPAQGKAHQDEVARGALDQGRASAGPVLADDQVALPVPRYRPVVDVRAPARSTACPRPGGSQPVGGGPLARPTP